MKFEFYETKVHKASKHEGVRYQCNECEFAGSTAGLLKHHKESNHHDTHASNLSMQPLQKVILSSTKKSNMKVLNIPVTNVSLPHQRKVV